MTRPPEDVGPRRRARPVPVRRPEAGSTDGENPEHPEHPDLPEPAGDGQVDGAGEGEERDELWELCLVQFAKVDAMIDSFPPEERSAAAAGMYTLSDGEVRTTYRMLRVVGSPPRRRLGPPIPDSADEEQY